MDPVTHAVAGLATAALSGEQVSFSNPIYLSAMLGAMAPDLDIVWQLKGDMAYLKHHRGASHGSVGLVLFSLGITALLHVFFPAASVFGLFMWSFLGGLSHTFLDVLNSYGARLFAPFWQRSISLNLLTIFDPVLLALFGVVIAGYGTAGWTGMGLYLLFRFVMSLRVKTYLQKEFPNCEKIIVMPAMTKVFAWSFLVDTDDLMFTGEISFFNYSYKIFKKLVKNCDDSLVKKVLQTPIGKLFTEFTPYFHIDLKQQRDRHVVRFFDLRYYTRQNFLHSATAVFDKNLVLQEAVFQPYNENRKISVC